MKKITLITEIVGALAIVITMIFVGVQFRENTKATKSATATSTIGAITEWYANLGTNEQASNLFWNFMADPTSLTQTERYQVIINLHGLWLTFQNSYYLVEEGTLDPRLQESLTETINGVKDQPGFHLYWETRKSIFYKEFREFIDSVLVTSRKASPGLYSVQNDPDLNLPDPLEAGWEGEAVCQVLEENESMRILKCVFPPGVGHEQHYHPPHIGYTLNGGQFSITDSTGTREVDVPTGSKFGNDQISVHKVLNMGKTTAEFLIIEYKK